MIEDCMLILTVILASSCCRKAFGGYGNWLILSDWLFLLIFIFNGNMFRFFLFSARIPFYTYFLFINFDFLCCRSNRTRHGPSGECRGTVRSTTAIAAGIPADTARTRIHCARTETAGRTSRW